jgi:NADP-dependent 3-hydroxy acid dehydrogenase YdfG
MMSSSQQPVTTAVVTGASRGFGAAIAAALVDRGHRVVGVARTAEALADLRRELGARFVPAVAATEGVNTAACAAALERLLTPAIVGAEIARLCEDAGNRDEPREYQLNGHGLHALA